MGIIQRQGLKTSIISYFGVAIGILSTLFVYPNALEVIGLFRSLFDASVLVGIFVLMGSSISAVRFFPKFQDRSSGHSGLLSWLLMVTGGGFILFLVLFPFLRQWMARFIFDAHNKLYEDLIIYIIPLTFCLAISNLLSRYISNFRRIAIPAVFDQLTIKITLPIIILVYLQGWLTIDGVMFWIVASFAFAALGMVYYLKYLGEWKLRRPAIIKDKGALKEYSQYSWYGLLAGIGSQVAFRIDGLMVAGMIQFQATGIYSIAWALSEIIIKPMRSLSSIAGPVLADHIEHNRMDDIKSIYRRSSLNMTIIGAGLFLLIWTVLPYIFQIMPNSEIMQQGTYVLFFLGLAQVWDMMTGVNNEIISYSKHYRFTLYLTLLLAGVNIVANFLFIRLYGLTGAAMATCMSMFVFNIVKLVFIRVKFGFYPFTIQIIPAIGFCVAAWMISTALPESENSVINLFFKSAVFCLLYGGAIWRFRISPDINHWIDMGWRKVISFVGKNKDL